MSNRKLRVAINGFGRIGRGFVRATMRNPEYANQIELVAINDLSDGANLAYLLRYDSVYGRFPLNTTYENKYLSIGDSKVLLCAEKEPEKLPWGELNVDVVVESTGVFETYEKAAMHQKAGAKRVVISAPGKGNGGTMILLGVNEFALDTASVTSNASCTTNAISPVVAILKETVGIKKAMLNTVHAYTATQGIVDSPGGKDFRRGRAAAQNIVPSSTGAASALGKIMPDVAGLFDGLALRVPVVDGSVADISFVAGRQTTVEEINNILRKASGEERWKSIFAVAEDPIVSSDVLGDPHASIADLTSTMVVAGDLVKVLAWYDNEAGYCNTLVQHVIKTGSKIV